MVQRKRSPKYERVKAAKEKHLKALLRRSNVVGVGVGCRLVRGRATKEWCVRVYVKKKLPSSKLSKRDVVPKTLEGVRTDVLEVGEVQLYTYTARHRPAHGGDSIGHFLISAGTLGYVFRDKTDNARVILSNNHILANSDTDNTNLANVGDCVTQPGPVDGGTCASDRIATLKRWVEWVEGGNTEVDAAIADLVNPSDVVTSIHDIGCIDSWRSVTAADVILNPSDPDNVQKTGRTTQHTTGKIIDIDATIWNGTTNMTETIVTNDMAYFGDSGSLLVDMNDNAVGLLWGGSPGSVVYYNRIENVLSALNIEFYPCLHIVPCLIGPSVHCLIGGPDHGLHCLTGPDTLLCRIGGPNYPLCRIGGPGDEIHVHCLIGPDVPQCKLGGIVGPICLACGPDSPIGCGTGGPDVLIDVQACRQGPIIDISVVDKRINPKDVVVIDKTKIPKGMQRSLMRMLERMAKER